MLDNEVKTSLSLLLRGSTNKITTKQVQSFLACPSQSRLNTHGAKVSSLCDEVMSHDMIGYHPASSGIVGLNVLKDIITLQEWSLQVWGQFRIRNLWVE